MTIFRIVVTSFVLLGFVHAAHGQFNDPVANDDAAVTDEDTPVTFNITDNDTDADFLGSINPATVDLDPSAGGIQSTLSLTEGDFSVDNAGNLTFTPALNYNGGISISYVVRDNLLALSGEGKVSVTVNAVNDPPVINSQQTLTINENQNITVSFADLNVTDPDNAYPTGFTLLVSGGANYTVSGSTITPDPGYSGTLAVNVRVNDGTDDSATFPLSVKVNDIPVITGQNLVTTPEDQAIALNFNNLLVTDTDNAYPTGFTMTADPGANYTLTGLTVTPAANFAGTLTIPVHVNDGMANSNTFSLSVVVTPVNDIPVIGSQNAVSTSEDQAVTLSLANVNVTDIDNPGFPAGFSMSIVSGGANYTFSGLTVTPAANYSGTLTVPVRITDPDGGNSANFDLSLSVAPLNDAPVITSQNPVTTNENQSVTLTLNDLIVADVDNAGYPAGFSMAITAGGANYSFTGLTVTPSSGFNGTLVVPVQVTDPAGSVSNMYNLQVSVSSLNDPPTINSQDAVTTNEDQAVTLALANLNVTDPDHPYPAGFSLAITGAGANYTFTGLTVTPAANFFGTLTVPVQVTDPASATSNVFNLSITVNPVNDAPVITGQNVLDVNEDQTLTIGLADLIVSDPDNTYPTGFTLTVLSGTNYTNTTSSITPAANFSGVLTVRVRVNDGNDNSAVFNLSVTVNPVNDAPVITGQQPLSTLEDNPITLALSNLIVSDPDNTYPTGFTMSVAPGANYTVSGLTVTPATDFSGTLTVSVTVNDGNATSAPFDLTITVSGDNDPPVANNDATTTDEDTPVTLNVVTNDTDADGSINPNSVDLNTASAGRQTSITTAQGIFNVNSSGVVTFAPAADFFGTATVTYTVDDNAGGTSNIATITITVSPINDPPVITGQNPIIGNEDQTVTINLSNLLVTDPDHTYPTGFTILVPTSGTNFTATGNVITPAANFSGTLTVTVQVNDPAGATSAAFNLTITINPVNDAPVITGQQPLTTNEDSPISIAFANLLVTDPDNNYPAGFLMSIANGANYTVSGQTITPGADFSGTLTVPVTVNDGVASSNIFNVLITVTAVNDAPVITGQQDLTVNEDQSITIALADLTVTDPDNSYPTGFTLTVLSGTNYTFSGTTVTPTPNFSGTLTVRVRVNDGTANSAIFNLSVTVIPMNDIPAITGQTVLSTPEDTPLTIQFSNLVVSDDDNAYPTGFTLNIGSGANYTVAGTTITPSANFSGTLSVPVTVNDGIANSNTFNLSVTVTPVNDAPVVTAQKSLGVNEDQSITLALTDLSVTDPDNTYPTGFSMSIVSSGPNYTFTGLTISPAANFSGTLTVPVRVNDGTTNSAPFNVSITVNPVNDAPVITGQTALSVSEDTPLTIAFSSLVVVDPDNSYPTGFTLTVLTGSNYTVSGNVITPNANYTGTLSVPVRVNDGSLNSNDFNLTVTVLPANDPPTITGQVSLTVNEDNSITLTLANLMVTDPDDAYPSGFSLTVLPGSNYTFAGNTITPTANFNGTITVPVRVNDGNADSAPFNVTITVSPVNDAPVITGQQPLSTNEEQPLTLQLSNLLVTDPDNSYPTGFSLTVSGGSNYTLSGNIITPAANFSGVLTVPVRVNDGSANSNIFNVAVTVVGDNDPPVITGQVALSVDEDNGITILTSHLLVTDPDNNYPSGFSLSVSPGANYTVSGNTITPALNFSGTLTVSVTVNDGMANSAPFNLQITVRPVNDAPIITGQIPLSTGEAQPITITLAQLFVLDPDDTYPNDFTLSVLPGAGYTLSGNTVTPNNNFGGLLLVKVRVNDGTVNSATYDLQILVNSVNDPPVITGQQTLTSPEDSPITIQLANLTVTDPDNTYPTGFTLTVLPGANYTFVNNTVTPSANFSGTLTVSVKVNDGLSDSAPFGLQVTITPVNDAPVITGQLPLETHEDEPITIQFANLLVVDPDNTYPAGFSITLQSGSDYTVSGNTVTPATNLSGTLKVPVRVNDGAANSNTFELQITVTPVNDAPVITGQVALSTAEDTPIAILLSHLIVNDPDNAYPTGFSLTVSGGTNYTVSGSTVTPALNFNGTLSVNVTVNDGLANSAVFPLQVSVSAVNTPPAITGQQPLTVNEDTPLAIKLSDLTVVDPDNAYPTGFTLTINNGANYTVSGTTITPTLNFNGNLTVPVSVNDGTSSSPVFNLLVKVNPVNDPPLITGQSNLTMAEDQSITILLSHLTVSDPDNSFPTGYTLNIESGPNYTVSGNTVTPVLNFFGNLTVNVTVSDGTANSAVFPLLVRVTPVNDPPTASGIPPSTIDEDFPSEVIVSLLNSFKDPEDAASALTYQIVSNDNPALFQSIVITAGEVHYKVKPNAFGLARVTIRATDSGGLTVQDVLTITVNGINDAPSFDIVPDQRVVENVSPQTVTITNVSKGALENTQSLNLFATSNNTSVIANPVITYDGVSATAQLTYTVQPNKAGIVTITINAIDDGSNVLPNRNTTTQTFVIEVVEINNAPTLDAITVAPIQEDAPLQSIPLTGISAGSGENQTLTVTAEQTPADALEILEVNYTSPQSTGSLRVKPKPNVNGSVNIKVTVTDSGPNSPTPNVNFVSRQFTLTIQPVNDLPEFTSTPITQTTVGELYDYTITVVDVDNTTLTLTALQKPAWATFTISNGGKQGRLRGTPPANAAGNSIVRLQAKDATGDPVVQEFTLIVNTLPVLTSFEAVTPEDIALVFQQQQFNAAYTDADANPISKVRIESLPKPELGTLSYAGSTVVAGLEIPFESISQLVYQPKPEVSGKDTIQWNAMDGFSYAEKSASIYLVITPVNDAPIVSNLETDVLNYKIGSGPQQITRTLEASDPELDSIATVEIRFLLESYEQGKDEFVFTSTETISAAFDAELGRLTLTGKAPASEYNTFIRSIQYIYLGEVLPPDVDKTIAFTLTDGTSSSQTHNRLVRLVDEFEDPELVTGFTPNGDNANNTWLPIRARDMQKDFENAVTRVYDKRGTLLFQTVGFDTRWDGTFNGELLPAGSYFFTFDLKLPFISKTYKGIVTILR